MGRRLGYYFLNFELYSDQVEFGPSLQRRRLIAAVCMYVALSLGIAMRQAIKLGPVRLNVDDLRWDRFLGACAVGLALLPPVMRQISKARRRPSWEHVIAAYSMGFLVDLSTSISLPALSQIAKAIVP